MRENLRDAASLVLEANRELAKKSLVKSVSLHRRLGRVEDQLLDAVAAAVALCVGAP